MSQDVVVDSKDFKAAIINLFLKKGKRQSCLKMKGKYYGMDSKNREPK